MVVRDLQYMLTSNIQRDANIMTKKRGKVARIILSKTVVRAETKGVCAPKNKKIKKD